MARCSSQSLIAGPNCLLFSSHRYHLSEDLAKQLAAKIKKGVVGKTGKTAPAAPRPTKNRPSPLYKIDLPIMQCGFSFNIAMIAGVRSSGHLINSGPLFERLARSTIDL